MFTEQEQQFLNFVAAQPYHRRILLLGEAMRRTCEDRNKVLITAALSKRGAPPPFNEVFFVASAQEPVLSSLKKWAQEHESESDDVLIAKSEPPPPNS